MTNGSRDHGPAGPGATRPGALLQAGRPGGPDDGDNVGIAVETRSRTRRPSMYKVLLFNDDYTPMDFVVHVLERVFGLTRSQAIDIMMTVHTRGSAVVGVFTYEIAETRVSQVMDFARRHEHPLQCRMEKE